MKKVSKALRKGNFTLTYPDGTIRVFENGKEVEMVFRCDADPSDTLEVTKTSRKKFLTRPTVAWYT